jgi:hypothetical protein
MKITDIQEAKELAAARAALLRMTTLTADGPGRADGYVFTPVSRFVAFSASFTAAQTAMIAPIEARLTELGVDFADAPPDDDIPF